MSGARHEGTAAAPRTAAVLLAALVAAALAPLSTPAAAARGGRSAPHPRTQRAPGRAADQVAARGSGAPYRAGVLLVGFRPGVGPTRQRAIERAAGAWQGRRLGPAIHVGGRSRRAVPLLLRVRAERVLAAVRELRADRAVAYAEPDYLMQGSGLVPNDPGFRYQWADSNTGQPIRTQEAEEVLGPELPGTPGDDDDALDAWQLTTGSRAIVVGEVDTGVDYTHPDLAANIWSNPGGVGGCPAGTHGYDVLARDCDPMDEDNTPRIDGHGTHVAGIIGAVGDNGIGVAGLNWQTTILPVKWMQNALAGETSALIEALQWLLAARQAGVNVRIVNDSSTFTGTAYSTALANEIELLGENDILFVAAAGNSGADNDEVAARRYPCGYGLPNEICVTSTDNNDELPEWANYGAHTVDLAAPGVSIASTERGGEYGYVSGASTAAPQVSGTAALVLSLRPSFSATELKADILDSVDPLPSLSGRVRTGGRLNVYRALTHSAPPGPSPPPPPAPSPAQGAAPAAGVQPAKEIGLAILGRLAISPRTFAVVRSARSSSARPATSGSWISYRVSQPSLVRFTVQAARLGATGPRRACLPLGRGAAWPRTARCTRYVDLAGFTSSGRAGGNRLRFSGRIGRRALAPGRYRLHAVPVFEGRTGVGRAVAFQIVR
jgi:subtilisin family serine protease